MQRVAVIGAGAAGLCAARHLSRNPTLFHLVVFEQSDCVGGTWVYTENTETDQYGLPVHSSMYSSLKTNLPKEVMAFPDFPFDKNLPSFIGHQDVLKYLVNYSEAYDLNKFIKFHTRVECVQPLVEDDKIRWNVQFSNVKEKHTLPEKQVFDAVMVCNGHFAVPKIPNIPGLTSFTGSISHSHTYRHPEDFLGKKLVVLGAGASGIDIALDLAKFAESVIISHWKKPLKSTLPENMKQRASIQEVVKNEVVFSDHSKEVMDGIIFCTGYEFDFSFLHPDCKLEVNDNRITPLYKHILHTHYPSLSFIGICSTFSFPLLNCQVCFVIASLTGSMQLPSKEQMEIDIEKDYQKRLAEGLPHRHAHAMGLRQWQYNDDLCHLAHVDPVPDAVRKLYNVIQDERTWNIVNYKKNNYKLIDDNTFDRLESAVH